MEGVVGGVISWWVATIGIATGISLIAALIVAFSPLRNARLEQPMLFE